MRRPRAEGEESELLRSWTPRPDNAEARDARPPRRPRPDGDEGYRPRSPRADGEGGSFRARRPRGEGYEDFRPRPPRGEGDGEKSELLRSWTPRPEGAAARRRGPAGDDDRPARPPRRDEGGESFRARRERPESEGLPRPRGGDAAESGLRSWKRRPEGEERPARPPRPEGGAGPVRRRRPEGPPRAEAPAESRPPRPVAQEPAYEKLEPTNPHVLAAAKALADVDHIVLDIERLVFGGEGLGRFEGIPIFVPRSAPGEKLRVRLTERRTGWGRAEIVEILEASPERRPAPCPYYDQCGGCDLQHLEESAQLRHKAAAVCESLVRQGGVEIPSTQLEVIPGDPWAYRLRAQLHIADSDRGKEVGYFARGSHQLVAIDRCPILAPELEAQLPSLPRLVRDEKHERVDLTCGDDHRVTCSPPVPNVPHGSVERSIGEFRYEIDARVFFQAHRTLVDTLVQVAIGDAEDRDGDAYDLYAGVGIFALPLSRHYKRVVAVEGDRVAVRFARRNVKANEIPNVSVEAISVDSFVELLPKNVARVLVDPPRVGLSTPVRRALIEARPRRLTYVSCHAPTLARDLKELLKVYRLGKLTLLDMFPQTGHMEVVAQLEIK